MFSVGIGNTVRFCIAFSISTFVNVEIDLFHNLQRVVNEGILMNVRQIVGQVNIRQCCTHLECVLYDGFYGLGQNDLRHLIVRQECRGTDILKLTSLFKGNGFCIIDIGKCKLIKSCNILANHDRGNLLVEFNPRQLCAGGILVGRARTAENHSAVGINNVSDGFTLPTCIQNVCGRARNILTVFEQASFAVNGVDTVLCNTVNEIISRVFYVDIALFIIAVRVEIHRNAIFGNKSVVNNVGLINTVCIKGINNLINNVCAGKLHTVYVVSGMICIPAVCNNNTVNISLAIGINTVEQFSAVYASKLAFCIDLIGMTQCGDGGTPFDNRAATVVGITLCFKIFNRSACATDTEYAVFISAFRTSRSFALCGSGGTDVEAPFALSVGIGVITVHFGLNDSLVCREGHRATVSKGNKTCFSAYNESVVSGTIGVPHSMRSQNVIFILFCGIIGNVIFTDTAVIHPTPCHPNTNGKLSKDSRVSNFRSGTSKGNNRIVMVVNIILCLEAIGNFHAFQFPRIDIVKIDRRGNGLNGRKVICDNIEPIDRAGRQQRYGRSRNFQANVALGCIYSNFANNVANITLIITDFHNDCMNAIIQIQIGNSNCSACRYSNICSAQYTVNIKLYRIAVQTGSIQLRSIFISLSHQRNFVRSNCLTGDFHTVGVLIGNGHAGKIGIFTVNGSVGVVNRKIVYIKSNVLIIVVISFTCGVMAVDLEIFKSFVIIQYFPTEIIPSAVFNT